MSTKSMADLFTAAAAAYALPISAEPPAIGESVTLARRAYASGEGTTNAARLLVEAANHLKTVDPEFASVEPEAIVLMLAANALDLLGVETAPSSRLVILAAEGEHDASDILSWLEDTGHGQYRAYLDNPDGGEESEDSIPFHIHVVCDYRANIATLTMSEAAAQ
jgi:hypothetical protein